VKTYSKGMRQRLGLAQAVLGQPRLLLLDEPTVGLDPIATQELYLLIDRLRQGGTSVILCSHVLPGVESHINRAAILAKGRLQAVGSLAQLRAEAGLPVRIRASGIGSSEHWRQRWSDAGHSARTLSETSIEVVAVNGHKLVLLRELLGEGEPEDIEIHQPSLEDLYRYYMERAGDVRTQEVRA
ncbi:ATP-binding cassette domain-containing protein, partial [Pseudomonas stutzeri]|nr:ATP-binding cassette domain-containing protein [Stutzerimonas degradans]